MAYQTLELVRTGKNKSVLTIAFNRPDIRNAFNSEMIGELTQVFSTEATETGIRAVVMKGNGSVFCAGGDLNWMKKAAEVNFNENLRDTTSLTRMFQKMNEYPRPLVGAVHGAVIGGGIGLVSVCDIVIATKDTKFGLSEVRLGLVPACIGPFVISKIGASQARRFFLSGERFSAESAREAGLIHEVVADTNQLSERVNEIVSNILASGPKALEAAKEMILQLSWPEYRAERKDPVNYVSTILAELRTSPEGQEGIRAFLEKRKPSWMDN